MRKLSAFTALALTASMAVSGAMACSSMYIGANLTENGHTYVGRSEDFANSRNKVMYVSPAANHKAGDVYNGCYGFTHTFSHDSYSYTAFRDDNLDGKECPNCGSTHDHTPYEEGGTNQMGVSVSATETLGQSDAAYDADPFHDTGIEESDIVTVILSEAATAREGVELLTSIYDEVGCCDGSGVYIADHNEVWYIENVTGTQYIALRLNADIVFADTNVSVIGAIDLDDTENVIASAGIIEVAKNGGFFVGDEEANIINYNASYNADAAAGARLKNALNYYNPSLYDFSETEPEKELYSITNVAADGSIVPVYTNIQLDRKFTTADVLGFWHVDGIGKPGNEETHVFELTTEDSVMDTVEWVAVNDASVNVFIPYYPMLTTDVAASLKLGTDLATFVTEQPAEGVWYPTTQRVRNEAGERVTVEGFKVLPECWADSYYWSVDALSNMLWYREDISAEAKDAARAKLAAAQQDAYGALEIMTKNVEAAVAVGNTEEAAATATSMSMTMTNYVHQMLVETYHEVVGE